MSSTQHLIYADGAVAARQDVAAASVAPYSDSPRSLSEAQREIDTLRSINSHLIRQVEVLRKREAHVQRLADRDGLTGLYNRRKMLELLDRAVADASQHGQCVGLLFLDLDGFKAVNDRYGHAAGDRLLMAVASRLLARARGGDYVCRYGGDEFVIILPRAADRQAVYEVAESIAERVRLPYCNDGIELRVTASVGVAIYPDEARDASDLMQRADSAMYHVKSTAAAPSSPHYLARRRDDPPGARFLPR